MTPSELARSYDEIAHVWQEPHIQMNGIAPFERALRFASSGHALDIGCGSSARFLDLLRKHGFAAEGLDVSERMVALARQNRPEFTFHHADISVWELPRSYDFISAWDSIWHLPMAAQEPVLRKICAGLAPGGVFIFTTGGRDGPEEKSDSSMGPPVHYSVLGIPRTLELLSQCGCVCRHLEYDQFPEQHLFIIAQKI
ncbi:MAG: SAM-dependent methyltransferase [Verrucomicrobia bacterium 12-59-8]|nr:MAG: SAM-dependent methyltransferase [Verrucomicrobia bacterium 12-59-8]